MLEDIANILEVADPLRHTSYMANFHGKGQIQRSFLLLIFTAPALSPLCWAAISTGSKISSRTIHVLNHTFIATTAIFGILLCLLILVFGQAFTFPAL